MVSFHIHTLALTYCSRRSPSAVNGTLLETLIKSQDGNNLEAAWHLATVKVYGQRQYIMNTEVHC